MLHIVGSTHKLSKDLLEKVALATFSFLGINEAEIELKFVSEKEITRLNSVYRKKNTPTDVLSFVLEDKPLLGQIFICYTFTSKQAKTVNKLVSDEVSLLLVHGILHIVGYDHETLEDESKMQEVERKILSTVGIQR